MMSFLSRETYGLVIILLSAILFSVTGCFSKLAANAGLASTELVFIRCIFQGCVVVIAMVYCKEDVMKNVKVMNGNREDDENPIIVTRGSENEKENEAQQHHPPPLQQTTTMQQSTQRPKKQQQRRLIHVPFGSSRNMIKFVVLRGVVGACSFLLYFFSLKTLPLGDAITLYSLNPIFTILLARLFLGEHIRLLAVIATVLSCTGAILIAGPTFLSSSSPAADNNNNSENLKWIGYITALTSSCFLAAVIVLMRASGKAGAHTLQLLFSWSVFGMLTSMMAGWVFHDVEPWKKFSSSATAHGDNACYYYVLGMCVFGIASHFLLNYAGRIAPANLAGIMRSTDVVWAYMIEILFFQQIPSVATIIGAILILISPIIIAIQKIKDDKERQHDEETETEKLLGHHHNNHPQEKQRNHIVITTSRSDSNSNNEGNNHNTNYGATNK